MFDFEDPWWLTAVVLMLVLWAMGVVIPIRLAMAPLQITRHYAELNDESTQDLPPPPSRPGIILPLLVFLVALALVYLSVRKRIAEPEGGNRWTWMAAAAGTSAFWALVLIMMTMRLAMGVG